MASEKGSVSAAALLGLAAVVAGIVIIIKKNKDLEPTTERYLMQGWNLFDYTGPEQTYSQALGSIWDFLLQVYRLDGDEWIIPDMEENLHFGDFIALEVSQGILWTYGIPIG